MPRNLMICTNALKPLNATKLNESEVQGPKYILEGVFAELDTENRNQRIYPKDEYLKHLAYLRDDIKKGEPLLGELDHPDDRFEVKLKEASHRVIDLWYDEAQNVVMGKIELLNTPNGKLAQSIVDQGIPLHISSRAAGSVNADHTVSIQQIYTYDLVCKPGFAGAVLHRVNESEGTTKYTDDVKNFLQSSFKMESMNAAPQYGFINEDMSVSEIKAAANLRNEAKELQINNQIEINIKDMTKPLNENTNPDNTVGKPLDISGNGASALGIPTALEGDDKDKENEDEKEDVSDKAPDADDKPAQSSDEKKEDDKKEEGTDEKCPKCGNSPCTCNDKKEDDSKSDDGKKEKESVSEEGEENSEESDKVEKLNDDDNEDSDKKDDDSEKSDDEDSEDSESSEDSGIEIIDVEAEFEDGKSDDMIKDVEPDFSDEEKKDDDSSSEESDKNDDEEAKDESERTADVDDDKKDDKDFEDDKKAKEAEKLSDKESKDIQDRKDSIMDKLDKLMDTIEKKNSEKKESTNESVIMAQYPVSMKMTKDNFAEFAKLDETQKNKVVAYLHDNRIADIQSINESWKNGIDYKEDLPVWLKYAPANYKALYEAASDSVKESIKTTADYIVFDNQYDVDTFWENSGLVEANERRLINESFINNLPKVTPAEKETNLPYSAEYIKMITEMACEYNKKY